MFNRRSFLSNGLASTVVATLGAPHTDALAEGTKVPALNSVRIESIHPDENLISYVIRINGSFESTLYLKLIGAANEYKEGDEALGLAAVDDRTRDLARELLSRTTLGEIDAHAPHQDEVYHEGIRVVRNQRDQRDWTLSELKSKLLGGTEKEIKGLMPDLTSDVIGCVSKLMSNEELISVGSKIFNPLSGTNLGAEGYLGARIQPNSPTDHPDDIVWQVFDGWAYAVGDMLLGTNPVSSDPKSVAKVERALQDLLVTFEIDSLMPHCVLSHIDIQDEVEQRDAGSTELYFQSIGGCESANQTFDTSTKDLSRYASKRVGRYGMYFETGQGADYTNGHGYGFDMVLHESRKYGLARSLKERVGKASSTTTNTKTSKDSGTAGTSKPVTGIQPDPWVHLNDVAGFIGPEVFRTREQLVRCCLEDIFMGKLHGLCIGLDVCSTLHMDVSLDDLDWCLEQVIPACPAYLMALPTKIDPMLGYLTTAYQDHVRLREKFDLKVNDPIWEFFKRLEIIDEDGHPTAHFGDPTWVYLNYRRAKGDSRPEQVIREEGLEKIAQVRQRGVFIAQNYGERPSDLASVLKSDVDRIYEDGKKSIWAELRNDFMRNLPNVIPLETAAIDREDYILHPIQGETLSLRSAGKVLGLRDHQQGRFEVQLVISDGLNALAIQEEGQLAEYLAELTSGLTSIGKSLSEEYLLIRSGRVRAGYQIGTTLFRELPGKRTIVHLIGERPGTGHRTFSAYVTTAVGELWTKPSEVDHHITKVISGIAYTALAPSEAARQTIGLL